MPMPRPRISLALAAVVLLAGHIVSAVELKWDGLFDAEAGRTGGYVPNPGFIPDATVQQIGNGSLPVTLSPDGTNGGRVTLFGTDNVGTHITLSACDSVRISIWPWNLTRAWTLRRSTTATKNYTKLAGTQSGANLGWIRFDFTTANAPKIGPAANHYLSVNTLTGAKNCLSTYNTQGNTFDYTRLNTGNKPPCRYDFPQPEPEIKAGRDTGNDNTDLKIDVLFQGRMNQQLNVYDNADDSRNPYTSDYLVPREPVVLGTIDLTSATKDSPITFRKLGADFGVIDDTVNATADNVTTVYTETYTGVKGGLRGYGVGYVKLVLGSSNQVQYPGQIWGRWSLWLFPYGAGATADQKIAIDYVKLEIRESVAACHAYLNPTPTPSPSPSPSASPSPSPIPAPAPGTSSLDATPTPISAPSSSGSNNSTGTGNGGATGGSSSTAPTPAPAPVPSPSGEPPKVSAGSPPSGGSCTASPATLKAVVDKLTVTCTGWGASAFPLTYTVSGTGYSSDLARDSPDATFGFFFPSSTGGSVSSSLTVKVKDANGLSTNFAIPNAVIVTPTVDASKPAAAQFDDMLATFNKQMEEITADTSMSFKDKIAKILANIESLKTYYSQATGTALRRGLRQTNADLLAKLSGALSTAMTTVTTEAAKSGVDLKDPATAGALVNFFSSVAPVATKTGALSEASALQGTQLLLKVIKENPNLATTPGVNAAALQQSLAGLVAALPPNSAAAASVRQETQKALADVSAKITLSGNTACGDQDPSRAASDAGPRNFKVCSSTRALTFRSAGATRDAVITFPANANGGADFQASVSELATSLVKPPAGYTFLSSIIEVTAASLAGQITQFPGGIQFEIPATGSLSTGQGVALRWLDADGSWKTDGCSAVSQSSTRSGTYTATCNHLTAFALLADSSALGVPYFSAGLQLAASALAATLAAAATLFFARLRQ